MKRRDWAIAWLMLYWVAGSARGFDISGPAMVDLLVCDVNERPIAGAVVTLRPEFVAGPVLSFTTDEKGIAHIEIKGGPDINRQMSAVIAKDDLRLETYASFSAGQHTKRTEHLIRQPVTVVEVEGPDGKPVANVPVQLYGTAAGGRYRNYPSGLSNEPIRRTDANGQYVSHHNEMTELEVSAGGQVVQSPQTDRIIVRLTAKQYARLPATRTIEGRLLLADGKPAVGWLVAGHIALARDAGGVGGPLPQFTYVAIEWKKVRPDGSFTVTAPGELLSILSPEGIPFMYSIAPENWAEGVHRLTLTAPALLGSKPHEVVDEAGKPMPGTGFQPDNMIAWNFTWHFRSDNAGLFGLAGVVDADGQPLPKIVADKEGRFAIPVYAGAQSDGYSGDRWPGTTVFVNEKKEQTVAQHFGSPLDQPADLKEITVRFVDGAGKSVEGFDARMVSAWTDQIYRNSGNVLRTDDGQVHFLAKSSDTGAHIEWPEDVWKASSRDIKLDGNGDETVDVTLDQSLRNKPLRGRVVDAGGKPVAGADVDLLFRLPAHGADPGGMQGVGSRHFTDALGRFEFAGAPDDCQIDAWKTGFPGTDGGRATAENRDVEVRLPAFGTLRVLLPESLHDVPEQILLHNLVPGFSDAALLTLEQSGMSLAAMDAQVGTYRMEKAAVPELGDLSDQRTTLTAGGMALIDLRKHPFAAGADAPEVEQTVLVRRGGAPAAGAEVAVFQQPFLADARGPEVTALDLSDAKGEIHFRALAGRRTIAVARIRGEVGGWTVYAPAAVGGQKGQTITVDLRPIESLNLPAAPARHGAAGHFDQPDGLEQFALPSIRSNDHLWSTAFLKTVWSR